MADTGAKTQSSDKPNPLSVPHMTLLYPNAAPSHRPRRDEAAPYSDDTDPDTHTKKSILSNSNFKFPL